MAGIGFELQRLDARDNITGRIASLGYGAFVAAGPWLMTIIGLGLIGLISSGILDTVTIASFRAVIIYAFANSLIVSAPVAMVCARLLSDALYEKRPEYAMTILVGGLLLAGASTAAATAWLYTFVFSVPAEMALAGVVASVLVAFLWIAIMYCGAIYDHAGIGLAFLAGTLGSLVGALVMAAHAGTPASMVWGYAAGLAITLFGLLSRIIATFPFRVRRLRLALGGVLAGLGRYSVLALGAFVGALGIWIDKWIVWSSAYGEITAEGLPHSPIYDSAMFVAYLAIVPSLAFFLVHLETRFFENYVRYFSDLQGHATLAKIEKSGEKLGRETLATIHGVILMQFGLCAFMAVFAPLIVDALGMQFRQIGILRFGVAGTLFHFIFLACSSVVLFLDLRGTYLGLQALFLALNAVMTLLTVMLGVQYLGYGYLVACCISGVVAYMVMIAALKRIDFYTFVASIPRNRTI